MARRFQHFALGPVLWNRVDAAVAMSPLDQTAFQRGVASAASAFDRSRSPLGAMQALVGGAVGVPVGNAVSVNALSLQVVVGAAVGLAAYWTVPPLWALVVAVGAPVTQRNEARTYARALEQYAYEAFRWNRRRELAREFRAEVEEQLRNMDHYPPGPNPSLVQHWAGTARKWAQLMTEGGGNEQYALVVEQSIKWFARPTNDPYGEDDVARFRNTADVVTLNFLNMSALEPPVQPERL
jgi:hypothetical protein